VRRSARVQLLRLLEALDPSIRTRRREAALRKRVLERLVANQQAREREREVPLRTVCTIWLPRDDGRLVRVDAELSVRAQEKLVRRDVDAWNTVIGTIERSMAAYERMLEEKEADD
jgi:hypothetical protein